MQESNPLEIALALAANDPASRPDFCRLLLESEIYIIGHTEPADEGRSVVPVGARMAIEHWNKSDGTPVIPFFTSRETLQMAIQKETRIMALQARDFFKLTRGERLMLNPSLSYGKEFFPNEIESLLATGLSSEPVTRVVQKDTRVLLGQPVNYPSEMISALAAFLPRHPTVGAAYLGLMQDPESGSAPALLVGFQGDGDMSVAMREAGSVAADTAPHGEPVDFVEVSAGKPGFSQYFLKSVRPFYERSEPVKKARWSWASVFKGR